MLKLISDAIGCNLTFLVIIYCMGLFGEVFLCLSMAKISSSFFFFFFEFAIKFSSFNPHNLISVWVTHNQLHCK